VKPFKIPNEFLAAAEMAVCGTALVRAVLRGGEESLIVVAVLSGLLLHRFFRESGLESRLDDVETAFMMKRNLDRLEERQK
jgi:hypothetical protein